MKSPSPALEATQKLVEISHLPASMNGNPFLYTTTLTAMMCGAVLGLYVMGWMGKDIIRDRKHIGFKSVLFNFRLMMALAGSSAFLACLPEVLYLQMYNDPEVSARLQAAVTTGKRIADSGRVWLIVSWVSLLAMIYPYVSLALIDLVQEDGKNVVVHTQVADYPGLGRLAKPICVFVLISLIAMAFAFAKVYAA